MSDDYQIYVDGGRPATLNDGAGGLTDCPALQEAVSGWHRLPLAQKVRATVKVIGGPVYTPRDCPASFRTEAGTMRSRLRFIFST
jgi:hypothetical protein